MSKNYDYIAGIVFFIQFLFVFFRTKNVISTVNRKLITTLITGNLIGACWLISITIGVTSMVKGELLPILAYFIGGTIGTYVGLKYLNK
jgi:hypothetical protein